MKLISFLSVAAALAAATFALGLVFGAFTVVAYTLTTAASLALIIANDYAPRRNSYGAGGLVGPAAKRERLPLAI